MLHTFTIKVSLHRTEEGRGSGGFIRLGAYTLEGGDNVRRRWGIGESRHSG